MDRTNTYSVFGVKGDEKTQEVLALAARKGVTATLRDLQTDPKANSDFLGRGHSRIPVLTQVGKPSFIFIGAYEKAIEELNKLDDVVLPDAPIAVVEEPIVLPPVETEESVSAIPDNADAAPNSEHGEATEAVTEPNDIDHHIATFENEGGNSGVVEPEAA